MKFKDEWRDAIVSRMHNAGFRQANHRDGDYILAAIAPLIVRAVIEECTGFVRENGLFERPADCAMLCLSMRTEVPKRLGIGGA